MLHSHYLGPRYIYTEDLWALHNQPHQTTARPRQAPSLPPHHGPLPLDPHIWEVALRQHPDRLFVEYILRGLELGFHIGFDATHSLQAASRNMVSAYATPQVVATYLQAECTLGRMLGPLQRLPAGLMISKFGVIPKEHQVDKWRLILDLSSPEGASVNDGISVDLSSVKYPHFDLAAKLIMEAGVGASHPKLISRMHIASYQYTQTIGCC